MRWIFSIGIEVKLENAERLSKSENGFDLGPLEKYRLREMLLSYEEKVYGNDYELLTENCQEFLCDSKIWDEIQQILWLFCYITISY